MLYDYVLTIHDEVNLIWGLKKLNSGTIIYICNRLVMFGLLYEWFRGDQSGKAPDASQCLITTVVDNVFVNFSFTIWAVVSALRVHALTRRNWWLSMVTFITGMVPCVLNTLTNVYDA
ncbi:uncharacterized protein C8Q71DRAFT_788781 [Rhodofomes roseus]|uniref:DUF6533 domain-containing protein n=1 Tax=Rhodofomes roseus TaxID=34475 RepID=A0ABQ8JZP4_9APHY|nr:uncharacterized protein C8Q71DRAFT_788781 [Rhodofomes roseus]KAH9829857.1 hypothetical protein C8Q71DRAFT_788781 [Rhodofomes roseus]